MQNAYLPRAHHKSSAGYQSGTLSFVPRPARHGLCSCRPLLASTSSRCRLEGRHLIASGHHDRQISSCHDIVQATFKKQHLSTKPTTIPSGLRAHIIPSNKAHKTATEARRRRFDDITSHPSLHLASSVHPILETYTQHNSKHRTQHSQWPQHNPRPTSSRPSPSPSSPLPRRRRPCWRRTMSLRISPSMVSLVLPVSVAGSTVCDAHRIAFRRNSTPHHNIHTRMASRRYLPLSLVTGGGSMCRRELATQPCAAPTSYAPATHTINATTYLLTHHSLLPLLLSSSTPSQTTSNFQTSRHKTPNHTNYLLQIRRLTSTQPLKQTGKPKTQKPPRATTKPSTYGKNPGTTMTRPTTSLAS